MIPVFTKSDKFKFIAWVNALEQVLINAWTPNTPVIKFYKGTEHTIYLYKGTSADETYTEKIKWTSSISKDEFGQLYELITAVIGCAPSIKYTRLTKSANGYRFRWGDNVTDCASARLLLSTLFANIRQAIDDCSIDTPADDKSVVDYEKCSTLTDTNSVANYERKKKMNDFSLTNLKDAIVNKVTNLDKKTVSILAILALLLLVVGKYNTIKGLVVGIKDKVTGSDDFKAMVADGTKAIDSLKKIVGVKKTDKTKKGKD